MILEKVKDKKRLNLYDDEFFWRYKAIYGYERIVVNHWMISFDSVIICNAHAFPKVFYGNDFCMYVPISVP